MDNLKTIMLNEKKPFILPRTETFSALTEPDI